MGERPREGVSDRSMPLQLQMASLQQVVVSRSKLEDLQGPHSNHGVRERKEEWPAVHQGRLERELAPGYHGDAQAK